MMNLQLINLGRNSVNATVTIKKPSFSAVYKEVGKHLGSKHYDLEETEEEGLYNVVAGIRTVGQIKVDKPEYMILL